ncbi:MAG: methyltransferase domain-containing protein [Betaproteobacteria bacterium]|nr:methyltransferase domain-containing protein [Betaproteobacteria bacterium]
MDLIERATIMHFHRHRVARFGEGSVRSLGWRNEASQTRRFEVIAAAEDFGGCAVLDLGCGRGDLKSYLDARYEGVSYIGVDQMPEFIADARIRYRNAPRTWFHECDFDAVTLPVVDHVVASGALSYRSADPGFHFAMIRKMYAAARRSVIFNMLDASTFPAHPLLVGHDRDDVAAFCRSLSHDVRVVAGYQDEDFSVCIRRRPDTRTSQTRTRMEGIQ